MSKEKTLKNDMTSGNIAKQLFFFALPLMAGQFLQQLYNLVDGLVISNFVNRDIPTAFSSINISSSLTFLFVALALGMSVGTGIMVAQFFGAKKYDDLRQAVSSSLIFLFIASLVLSLLGFVFAKGILRTLMALEEGPMLNGAAEYLSIYCLGLVFQFMYNAAASILRAVGDSKATLYFLVISTVVNIALDLLFVIVFRWGIAGTAIATVIAQASSAVLGLIYMFKKYPIFRFAKGEFRIYGDKLKTIIRLSIPATIQQCVVSLSNISMQRLVNSFGQSTIDAYGAITRVQTFALIPSMSLGTSLVNFVGQNVGAGDFKRAKRGHWTGVIMATAIACFVSALMYIFSSQLLGMFNLAGDAYERSMMQLHFLVWVLWALGLLFVSYGILQGSGDMIPVTIASMTSLVLRVVFAYLFAKYTSWGWKSIYIVHPISTVLACGVTFGRYFSMKWKDKALVKHQKAAPAPEEKEAAAES